MAQQENLDSTLKEIKDLKKLFDKIKGDSEEFVTRAKAFSETGAHEAKEMLSYVRSRWDSVASSFSGMHSLGDFFGMGKTSPKKSSVNAKLGAKTTKKKATKTRKH